MKGSGGWGGWSGVLQPQKRISACEMGLRMSVPTHATSPVSQPPSSPPTHATSPVSQPPSPPPSRLRTAPSGREAHHLLTPLGIAKASTCRTRRGGRSRRPSPTPSSESLGRLLRQRPQLVRLDLQPRRERQDRHCKGPDSPSPHPISLTLQPPPLLHPHPGALRRVTWLAPPPL